jgi:hypothetical protein
MGISEIRKKSNLFVANIEANIETALMEKEQAFTDINRMQMLAGKKSDDNAILPKYSPAYAKKKGFTTPNLKLTGAFQGDMFFQTDGREFFVTSSDEKMEQLTDRYGDMIFGIPKSRLKVAQELALGSLARLYNRFVLND